MNNIDKSNFRGFILQAPEQFKTGFELAKNRKIEGEFESLTISGMGGSALPVDLLVTFLDNLSDKTPNIYINRSYSLPKEALKKSLNIVSSYSGNTEETISVLEELAEKKISFIGISSGGKIEELCIKHSAPHIKLPIPFPNYQPRMGTGYFFASMLQILITHSLIRDVSKELLTEAEKFKLRMEEYEAKGKELAAMIKGKTPVIYTSQKLRAVAMIWKIKINENAKTPAFWNFFPELNHNEMVGFTNPQAQFLAILLKDPDDDERNKRRYKISADILKDYGIESKIIEMDGESLFSKMFLSITLADWTSYYLALSYNQDPAPVEMVEKLKKILSNSS